MNNVMSKNQLEGMIIQKIDDSKAFENLSLNGRYTLKNRENFKILSIRDSLEANRLMALVFKWETI